MKQAYLVFPHQLFDPSKWYAKGDKVILVEEALFFNQYAFHRQKIAFHRATMQHYAQQLKEMEAEVCYINAQEKRADIRELISQLKQEDYQKLTLFDPVDDWLSRRLQKSAGNLGIDLVIRDTPLFLNTHEQNKAFFRADKKKIFQTSFYIEQRKKWQLLIEGEDQPQGGKWSFDAENRKRFPKNATPPSISFPDSDTYWTEAVAYTKKHYAQNPGVLNDQPIYPINPKGAAQWLEDFLRHRFHGFGPYEDAIVKDVSFLHHSVLTPMLNVGLITPDVILDRAIAYAQSQDVPMNSLEGFVRQIIGWREFIRGIYVAKGRQERTRNYWGFQREIPASFYTGDTGIAPIDQTIRKVLRTGYCHHIERLMVLGNFMLLCEFHPDAVYKWFMELFVDAYDWVMVPNIYGMSQFADGGFFATKPYISGSNYILKMSDYSKGEWQQVWDGLFWRFMNKQRDFFGKNPRLKMLLGTFDRFPEEKKKTLLQDAELFLSRL